MAGEDRHVGVAVGAGEGGRGVGRLHDSLVLAVDDGLPATVRAGLVVQRRQRRGARPRSAVGRMVVQRAHDVGPRLVQLEVEHDRRVERPVTFDDVAAAIDADEVVGADLVPEHADRAAR